MKTIQGTPVSSGYAVGQLYVYKTLSLECERVAISAERVAEEKRTLACALEKAKESVKNLIAHNIDSGSKDAYAIFEGYLEIINDEELQNDITACIEDKLEIGRAHV